MDQKEHKTMTDKQLLEDLLAFFQKLDNRTPGFDNITVNRKEYLHLALRVHAALEDPDND